MRLVVLDAATLGEDLDLSVLNRFGEVRIYRATTAQEAVERLQNADVAILNKVKLTEEILTNTKQLKLICIAATGFDNVDLNTCRKQGIAVCNVVGYSTQCVAQLTLTMALSLMTKLPEFTGFVQSGEYSASGIPNRLTPVYHEISGKTWGIIGFGNIGKQVGVVARAMGCRVLVNKRTPIEGWDCVDLDCICKESDILSIHTPLNESTRGLLDEAHVAMLKPDAIVINVARGAVTDENALAKAVSDGKIGGLGVDVYSQEPFPISHSFDQIKTLPNVCLTPHMAWGGYETRVRLLNEIMLNIDAFLGGSRRNRVD